MTHGAVDVRALRERLEWSQGQLARFLGVSDRSLWRWEGGATPTGVVSDWLLALDQATKTKGGLARVRGLAERGANMTALVRAALEGTSGDAVDRA